MSEIKEKRLKKNIDVGARWLHEHHFFLIVLILNFANFLVPLVWTTVNIYIVYSPLDALMGWILIVFTTVFFLAGIYMHLKDKNTLYNIGLLAGLTPLYILLGLYTVYHVLLGIANILAIITIVKVNKGRKKIIPRFKTLFGKLTVPLLILTMLFPIGFYLLMPNIRIPVEIEDNSSDENLEINWMWAEIWNVEDEVINALEYCNNLEDINISIMVGLPEDMMLNDTYTDFIINQTEKLTNAGITWDFMPLLPLSSYGYDGLYINDITIDRYMGTIEIFKYWVVKNNLTDKFRVICIDTELYWEKRNELYFQWWPAYNVHEDGAAKLEDAVEAMKEVEGDHPVVCATFGMHLDDFVDFDDAQLQMMQLSVFPPWNWDGVGVMIYETGFGSDYSIYSSCNAMRYYFDDASIPYIISAEGDPKDPKDEDLELISTKFKIIKNMGFQYTGAWALTDFLYYIEDYAARNDNLPLARVIGGERFSIEQFKELHEDISEHEGKITVYYETFQHSAVHFALQFVDVWLFNRFVYDGQWPKIKKLPDISVGA